MRLFHGRGRWAVFRLLYLRVLEGEVLSFPWVLSILDVSVSDFSGLSTFFDPFTHAAVESLVYLLRMLVCV